MDVDTMEPRKKAKQNNGAVVVTEAGSRGLASRQEQLKARRQREANKAFGRGKKVNTKNIRDKKLRSGMKRLESKADIANLRAKDSELLLENTSGYLEAEGDIERTYKVRQDDIIPDVAVETASKRFELKLDGGPFVFDYSRTGKDILMGGKKGCVSLFDFREGKLKFELNLQEMVRDVKCIQNNYVAVSQRRSTYIYDSQGVEVHELQKFKESEFLTYLPYHYLLAGCSTTGMLRYMDTSTGSLVSEIPTKLGQPTALCLNPWNGIINTGHQNGQIQLWAPSSSTPLVKLLAHRGPVRAVDVSRDGTYLVSTGQDQRMSVWDLRNTYKEVNSYHMRQPASTVSISDTGLTAVGWGTQTQVWRGLFDKSKEDQEKVQSPYLTWSGEGKRIERVRWCPFEDLLGVGTSAGFSSLIVPGAGEANFDALEVNPFETKKQRQESEVRGLLNKLKPEMIALDPNFIGNLDLRSDAQRKADKDLDAAPANIEEDIRNRARGKNGALKKYLRKQRKKNIIDEKRLKVDEIWKEQQNKNKQKIKEQEEDLGPALSRFARRE